VPRFGRATHRLLPSCLTAIAACAAPVSAQPVPLGNETIVNSFTTGAQRDPAVARDAEGNLVVVWESAVDAPSAQVSIRGQRYDSVGSPVGTEFQVETSLGDTGAEPDVAMRADGSFVVVWKDYDTRSGSSIRARAYDRDAVPRSNALTVSTDDYYSAGPRLQSTPPEARGFGYGYKSAPSIAPGSSGDFVVVWSSGDRFLQYFGYVNYLMVRGRRVASDGILQGTEFHVGGSGFYWSARPDIAAAAPGKFVVVWSESSYEYGYEYGYYTRTRSFSVLGRQLGEDGETATPAFYVGPGGYRGPAVAADATGRFIVAWPTYPSYDSDYEVLAQRFYGDGNHVGDPITVSRARAGTGPVTGATNAGRFGTDLALTGDGHFIVVWAEGGSGYHGNSDGDSTGVFARTYTFKGTPIGDAASVNSYTAGPQSRPAIVTTADDDLFVAWRSGEQDGDDWSVVSRRMRPSPDCGDATADGETTATDALSALAAAVGTGTCPACVCDSDGSGSISATDALRILEAAVGQPISLSCTPC